MSRADFYADTAPTAFGFVNNWSRAELVPKKSPDAPASSWHKRFAKGVKVLGDELLEVITNYFNTVIMIGAQPSFFARLGGGDKFRVKVYELAGDGIQGNRVTGD